jgi:hypothetical protein
MLMSLDSDERFTGVSFKGIKILYTFFSEEGPCEGSVGFPNVPVTVEDTSS